jgi:4-diphosphocytidyl-2-C-methyl-D-erythritol kinase
METASTLAEGIPAGPENLAWRAARAFMECLGEPDRGFTIHLRKAIPHGAGLGGGSSDAAAVLRALAQCYPGAVSSGALHTIAAALGSDVPFFLLEKSARGRGRGEILEPIAAPWQGEVLLIKPPFGVPTAWAYQAHRPHSSPAPSGPATLWQNDLEHAVFRKYLLLPILKEWLIRQPGVVAAMLCGSGATLLAALETGPHSQGAGADLTTAVRQEFGPTFWVHLTRTAVENSILSPGD